MGRTCRTPSLRRARTRTSSARPSTCGGLPRPLKPESYQLLGRDAEAAGVGSGRVVQVLKGGILGGGVGDNGGGGGGSSVASLVPPLAEIWLSSGVAPAADGAGDTLEIFPPFRLEVGRGGGGGRSRAAAGGRHWWRRARTRTSGP